MVINLMVVLSCTFTAGILSGTKMINFSHVCLNEENICDIRKIEVIISR